MTRRIRVLFVGGWGRSGSTLIDRILGQAPGVFSAGEIREIWERGCLQNRPCGCDQAFRDCEIWREIGDVAFGGWDEIDLDRVLELRFTLDRPWSVPYLAAPVIKRSEVREYVAILDALYGAIVDVTGADVIVDSSKIPSHAFLLRRVQRVDLRLLHLVRDSRAVAYSWQKVVEKRVTTGNVQYLPQYGPVASSIRWLLYNAQTRALARLGVPYRRIRYEDFIGDPRCWTERILAFAGIRPDWDRMPFAAPDVVVLGPNHTVDGNPVRFATGPTTLRRDDEWRTLLPARDRRLVTLATLPALIRYGYRPLAGSRR